MSDIKALPVVKKGEELEAWLARAVPALVEQQQMDETAATELATQAWNKVNGAKDEAPVDGEGTDAAESDPAAEDDAVAPSGKKPPFGQKPAGDEDTAAEPTGDAPAPGDEASPFDKKPATDVPNGIADAPAASPAKPMAGAMGAPMAGALQPGQTPTAQPGQQQSMNWNDSASWGNGLDGNAQPYMEEESDGRRDALALGPVEDAAQLLENWFVANVAAYASSLAATLMDSARVSEEEGKQLNKSIAGLLEKLTQNTATIGTYFEARIHQDFTNMADSLRGDGHLTREERIALSSCIGDALQALTTRWQPSCRLPHRSAHRGRTLSRRIRQAISLSFSRHSLIFRLVKSGLPRQPRFRRN